MILFSNLLYWNAFVDILIEAKMNIIQASFVNGKK
jgi:hypothetical protein